jgi:hypothetical protein
MDVWPVMNASDDRLLLRYRNGDRSALDLLWARHRSRAHRALIALTGSADPAQLDEVRDAVATAAALGGDPVLGHTVLSSARHVAAAARRPGDIDTDLIASAEYLRRLADVHHAYDRLGFTHRTVLWYAAVDRLPPRLISPHVGGAVDSTGHLIGRALDTLRRELPGHLSWANPDDGLSALGEALAISTLGLGPGTRYVTGRFRPAERDTAPHYSGLYAEDHPPVGLCVATLTVLDSSGFEREFEPVMVDEHAVKQLVHQGESL